MPIAIVSIPVPVSTPVPKKGLPFTFFSNFFWPFHVFLTFIFLLALSCSSFDDSFCKDYIMKLKKEELDKAHKDKTHRFSPKLQVRQLFLIWNGLAARQLTAFVLPVRRFPCTFKVAIVARRLVCRNEKVKAIWTTRGCRRTPTYPAWAWPRCTRLIWSTWAHWTTCRCWSCIKIRPDALTKIWSATWPVTTRKRIRTLIPKPRTRTKNSQSRSNELNCG